ncbi:MAG: tetratricopeptide repeat protein [Saprospiraceae bacterium]|nr:tetratricopeptide repeat protein [Saprospiraceae bacterium]
MIGKLFVATLLASGYLLFAVACKNVELESGNLNQRPPDFHLDSLKAEQLIVWAGDQDDKKKSIDTLKPLLDWYSGLCHQSMGNRLCLINGHVLFEIGFSFQLLGLYDSAFIYLQQGYDHCMEHFGEKHILTTMFLNKLAFCYSHFGDLKRYRENLFHSFDLRREILDSNDIFLSLAYGNMGGFYD